MQWVAVMQHIQGLSPAGALLCASHIGRILLIADAAGCLGCFNSVLPSVLPSAFLPLCVCVSRPLRFFSPPSFCLSQAPHFSSSSICHPSPRPLLLPSLRLQVSLSMGALAPVRHPFSPPSSSSVSLSVLRRHL